MKSLIRTLRAFTNQNKTGRNQRVRRSGACEALTFEALQPRALLATFAVASGDWTDSAIWSDGVPHENQRAVIGQGFSVQLDGADHFAKELVIHGELEVNEDASQPDKTLTTEWIHVNSNGLFKVGSEADRFDEGQFTLELNGTDLTADHVIETAMGTMTIENNNGFLMTAMMGRVEFFGADKLSFTKLAATADAGDSTIIVENVIERNYAKGEVDGGDFVTAAGDDGMVNWEVGDQIVIASSSYNYAEEDVRTITAIVDNSDGSGTGTSTLTLDEPLSFRHYGLIETYGESDNAAAGTTPASQTYQIDMRAEVALLSRNVKIQGLASQDTDMSFGDRWNIVTEEHVDGEIEHISGNEFTAEDLTVVDRVRAAGLSDAEAENAPGKQVGIGVGGHIMFMPTSGQIKVDGIQLEGMGQSSQKGRYPIHWHLGGSRPDDLLRNTSITNSNNRGVTIHGTSDLSIEGVVLHDIHGHGFFFEDAAETGNELIANIALGIHTVGGNDANFASPGTKDPFIVDTHDSVLETGARFSSSAAFWITNPTNTFVGNIAAGAGDARVTTYASDPGPAGTGFWYAIPRTVLGASADLFPEIIPIHSLFGTFDNNTSHSTAIGLNFDRGSDIEDGNWKGELRADHIANRYSPRTDPNDNGTGTSNIINGFTNYKASEAALYHRGEPGSFAFNNLRVADSKNGPWAVFETEYNDGLFVGHSVGNNESFANSVGGPRLYDGAGLYTNTHFAGFQNDNAYAFQVEGSSFGPTMYHAFRTTSFENDGTYGNISHAVSDFQQDPGDGHDLGKPYKWIKAVMDLDGTLTGATNEGGSGYSIVPNIDFLTEIGPGGDVQPAGWDAVLTDDIYARIRIQNKDDGEALFPSESTGEPLVRFTARDNDFIDVMGGQDINGDFYWTQTAAKTDGDGEVEGTFTVEFMRNGLPKNGFVISMKNQDGGRPSLVQDIQDKVDAARIVVKIVAAGNYTPENATEVFSQQELRQETSDVVFLRDGTDLFLNTGIRDDQDEIQLTPGDALQTAFAARTVDYGTSIEAEEFDNGVEGIAFSDSSGPVDLDEAGTKIVDIEDGEWVEYTANITSAAFRIGVNVSIIESGAGQIRILAANSNSAGFLRDLGTVNVPDAPGTCATLWLDGVNLDFAAGTEGVIRLEFIGSGFEVDSMQFESATQTPYSGLEESRVIKADNAESRIELEEFDEGGQGVSYFDTTPGNTLDDNEYRTNEDVDANSSLVTNDVREGEWLEYTTDIHAGIYDVKLKKAWGGDDSGAKLFVGQSNSTTDLAELGFFSFANADGDGEITLTDIDLTPWAGRDKVIRIEIVGDFMGIDYLDFISKSQAAPTADIVDVTPAPRNTSVGVVTVDFDEDVTGVDVGDLTLSRDGSIVDISSLTLVADSPSQYSIDLSSVTSAAGTYELTLNGVGSGIEDASGNAMNSNATEQFVIDLVGPQVQSVVINDGSAQRSMVSEITLTFSEEIVGAEKASSYVLTNTTTGVQVIPTVITELVDGKTVARLTFSGEGFVGNSLADGNYSLTVLAASTTDAAGNQLDGDGDGISGDSAVDSFFRHYGDDNGDGIVNVFDLLQFRNAFGGTDENFDFNGDGNVNVVDLLQFRIRFGQSI